MPGGTGWGEAWRLFVILGGDPSSHVGAALAGWQYPATREELALGTLIDRFQRANFKKAPAYPRPWDEPPKRHGTGSRTKSEWAEFKARKIRELRSRRDG